jgi:hypothetical protein
LATRSPASSARPPRSSEAGSDPLLPRGH